MGFSMMTILFIIMGYVFFASPLLVGNILVNLMARGACVQIRLPTPDQERCRRLCVPLLLDELLPKLRSEYIHTFSSLLFFFFPVPLLATDHR